MPLAPTFLAFLPDGVRPRVDDAALEDALGRLTSNARAGRPGLDVSEEELVTHVAERLGPELTEAADMAAALAELHGADLLLALACRRGDRVALDAFDRAFGADIDLAIKKSPSLGIQTDEFRQLVRTRLFVAEPDRPAKIASYAGKGPLQGWVRVTATRLVLDLARRDRGERTESDAELFDRLPGAADLETDVIRADSRKDLAEAMRRAFLRLDVKERNLLRQRYLYDLSGDRIAQMHGVHRATAFGWIEAARKKLLSRTREELGERGGKRELESLLAVLGSRLDISLRGVLKSEDGSSS
ncbi:MAG: hypothetical protein HOV80_31255 [Polyangiaceae bacterium]|nr:hypothetical protein [Polyangiaceae bacterium]